MKKSQLKNYFGGLLILLLFMAVTLFIHCYTDNTSSNMKSTPILHTTPLYKSTSPTYSTNKLMTQSIGVKTHKDDNQLVKVD
jgi:predicted RND superfamily exporter protein